jgi:CRISPR-associated protein (TIGR03984 family)
MWVAGCILTRLDEVMSNRWLDSMFRGGLLPDALGDRAWLLCHCDDGVTWGRRDGDEWRLGSKYFPDLCPTPSEANVQELRVFSPTAEVLIWRTSSGFCGRMLHDSSLDSGEQPDRPMEELRVLLGSRVRERIDCFARVEDGGGSEQALPVRLPEGPPSSWPRLRVRHYFARDELTGCVRLAMTRLVEFREV